jgi:predicted ArsR family transcriptional regulator
MQRQRRLTQGTAGRIIEVLRRKPLTIDELAAALGLTRTAVRSQLATLQRDGVVEARGMRRGVSKPARTFGVTAEAELDFSRAYVPILSQLLHVLADRLSPEELDALMREVGRTTIAGRARPRGPLGDRVAAASDLLNDLGGLTEVRAEPGYFLIESYGCPLAAVTVDHPEMCNTLESLLSEFVGDPVTKCCDRYDRQRCCFEVAAGRKRATDRLRLRS